MREPQKPWIGVDLDGTLALQDGMGSAIHIGEPIQPVLDFVRRMVEKGMRVKIFTARVDGGIAGYPDSHLYSDVDLVRNTIIEWCKKHIGCELEITNIKDGAMQLLIDDKAIHCSRNTGTFYPMLQG
jgi:hypothetical protein